MEKDVVEKDVVFYNYVSRIGCAWGKRDMEELSKILKDARYSYTNRNITKHHLNYIEKLCVNCKNCMEAMTE